MAPSPPTTPEPYIRQNLPTSGRLTARPPSLIQGRPNLEQIVNKTSTRARLKYPPPLLDTRTRYKASLSFKSVSLNAKCLSPTLSLNGRAVCEPILYARFARGVCSSYVKALRITMSHYKVLGACFLMSMTTYILFRCPSIRNFSKAPTAAVRMYSDRYTPYIGLEAPCIPYANGTNRSWYRFLIRAHKVR